MPAGRWLSHCSLVLCLSVPLIRTGNDPHSYRANKLLTPEEAFGEKAKDIDFKPKRSLEEELDVLKDKVF